MNRWSVGCSGREECGPCDRGGGAANTNPAREAVSCRRRCERCWAGVSRFRSLHAPDNFGQVTKGVLPFFPRRTRVDTIIRTLGTCPQAVWMQATDCETILTGKNVDSERGTGMMSTPRKRGAEMLRGDITRRRGNDIFDGRVVFPIVPPIFDMTKGSGERPYSMAELRRAFMKGISSSNPPREQRASGALRR